MPAGSPAAADEATAARLRTAPFELVGRFADASNATLLVRLLDRDPRTLDEIAGALGRPVTIDDLDPDDLAVFKPRRGEAPLWDFPEGTLHRREVAAYEVSRALGWDLVPVTVLATSPELGVGSLQRFVPHDPAEHYFHLVGYETEDGVVTGVLSGAGLAGIDGAEGLDGEGIEGPDRVAGVGGPPVGGTADLATQLCRMVLFDLVIDNADRKGGHVLVEHTAEGPRLRLVDHGVSFHVERKLRTVAWHLAGDAVPPARRAEVVMLAGRLDGPLGDRLDVLLSPEEIAALADRIDRIARLTTFPEPTGRRPFPWPML